MRSLTPVEEAIYNEGERLIPEVTHDTAELIRHRSSYVFFRKVIENDLRSRRSDSVTIIDLGCGVGHGCVTLADIPGASVLGVDMSSESIEYARRHYARANVRYEQVDLLSFIPRMPEYDYVVSRNVFEHIAGGLELARSTKWRLRLMIDVPYAEPEGRNPHHLVHNIREDAFAAFAGRELFFQSLEGTIYDARTRPAEVNIIICTSSDPTLPRVSDLLKFPVRGWEPPFYRFRRFVGRKKQYAKAVVARIRSEVINRRNG
jgi:SAM-dependent methyltransferase